MLVIIIGITACGDKDIKDKEDTNSEVVSDEVVKEEEVKEQPVKTEESEEKDTMKDSAEILTTIHGYYNAIKVEDLELLLSYAASDPDTVRSINGIYKWDWSQGTKHEKDLSGINIYETKDESVFVLYSLREVFIGKDANGDETITTPITTLYSGTLVQEDGKWKLGFNTNLEGILYDDEPSTDYKNNPNKYITDYIEWYLENEDVQNADKIYNVIKAEDYK